MIAAQACGSEAAVPPLTSVAQTSRPQTSISQTAVSQTSCHIKRISTLNKGRDRWIWV